jgi:hypothetical protein
MLTVQVPVPVQAPLQPVNVAPAAGAVVSVTLVPEAILALHVVPQSIALGLDATVPAPAPLFATLRVYVVTAAVPNVAVTLRAAVMLTVQVPVPVQAPLQPEKVEPVAAAAVRVTEVPELNEELQVDPQFTPAGDEVTVPVPVPLLVRVRR